jgi:hypothetical protein
MHATRIRRLRVSGARAPILAHAPWVAAVAGRPRQFERGERRRGRRREPRRNSTCASLRILIVVGSLGLISAPPRLDVEYLDIKKLPAKPLDVKKLSVKMRA